MSTEPSADRGFAISARALAFAYGTKQVLADVSLQVGGGEVVGLLGPNGSGKSTLLRILSGVLPGYRGDILLEGRHLSDWERRDLARSLAVVPQEPRFGFPFSVMEAVLMGRHPHLGTFAYESEKDLALARDALAQVGALHLAERTVTELSSGERQRVVFARALAQQPRALLLDEPATFMDIRHQVALYDLIAFLARDRGLSVLLVLHDLNLAAEYCDRLYLLRGGSVHCSGRPEDVITNEHLAAVFEAPLHVIRHPLSDRPLVLPLSQRIRAGIEASSGHKKKKNHP